MGQPLGNVKTAEVRYMFPSIPKRDMNRYLKDILKKLSETVPSLMELYPTALSRAEIRKEQLYQEMCKKEAKGEKFDAEKNKYFCQIVGCEHNPDYKPAKLKDTKGLEKEFYYLTK